jgi:hypothetical protein
MATLIVKLNRDVRPENGPTVIRNLLGPAAVKAVDPLLPGDPDPANAGLFEVALTRPLPEAKLAALRQHDEIEYAHAPSPRKPV